MLPAPVGPVDISRPAPVRPPRPPGGGINVGGPAPRPRTPGELPVIPVINVGPGVDRLRLSGRNLIGAGGPPTVRLNNRLLSISTADEDELIVEIPADAQPGELEIELPHGQAVTYQLSFVEDGLSEYMEDPANGNDAHYDPWAPGDEVR